VPFAIGTKPVPPLVCWCPRCRSVGGAGEVDVIGQSVIGGERGRVEADQLQLVRVGDHAVVLASIDSIGRVWLLKMTQVSLRSVSSMLQPAPV